MPGSTNLDTGTIRYEVGKIQITLDTRASCDTLVDVMNERWEIREVFRDNAESYITAPLYVSTDTAAKDYSRRRSSLTNSLGEER